MGTADAHANKRINLAAPLISVRRHAGAGAEAPATALPAYRADATSGPLGHAGAVPFGWEHRPGHPKSVRTRRPPPPQPPCLTAVDEPPHAAREPTAVIVASGRARDQERCSDVRDDVSCVTANCSAAGLSDAASACSARGPGPGARGSVMMDRFLPAAHAVAARSPQNTFRKAGYSARPAVAAPCARGGGGGYRTPAQRRLPFRDIPAYQYHLPPLSHDGKNVDDDGDGDGDGAESDAHSTAGFASRRCGLLPTRCVKGALLLSHGARRAAGRTFLSNGDGRSLKEMNPLQRCSRNGQQHTGDDPGGAMQSWEEVYIKSLLRSGGGGGGGLMGPAAAVASELDRTVRELYKRRGGQAVHLKPKASHLGLILVLDRSNEACGHHGSPARKLSRTGDTASLLPATTTQKGSPDAAKQPRRVDAGEHGFPLLPVDKEAVAGRELALCAQPPLPAFPLPKSPTESWLSCALPSVSTRPPATSFLGLHVQPKKHAPSPWCSIDSGKDRS